MAKILIIDDDIPSLQLVAYLLRHFGHEVFTAYDAEEGYALAERQLLDLIFCDIKLPKMNGLDFAKKIKADPQLRSIPLVAMTAFVQEANREEAFQMGYNDYCSKPIDPTRFIQDVESYLRKGTSSQSTQ